MVADAGATASAGAVRNLERDEFSFDFRRHCFASLAMTIRSNLIPLYTLKTGKPGITRLSKRDNSQEKGRRPRREVGAPAKCSLRGGNAGKGFASPKNRADACTREQAWNRTAVVPPVERGPRIYTRG